MLSSNIIVFAISIQIAAPLRTLTDFKRNYELKKLPKKHYIRPDMADKTCSLERAPL